MTTGQLFEVLVEPGEAGDQLPIIKVMVPEHKGAIYVPRVVVEMYYTPSPVGKTQEAYCALHSHSPAVGMHVATNYEALQRILEEGIGACPSVEREAQAAVALIMTDVQRELDDLPGQYL